MKKFARLLKSDGTAQVLNFSKMPTLKQLQDLVGGYIECVPTRDQKGVLVCDEEGVLKGKDVNISASILYGYGKISGDVVLLRGWKL